LSSKKRLEKSTIQLEFAVYKEGDRERKIEKEDGKRRKRDGQ